QPVAIERLFNGVRILLAEDNPINQKVGMWMLEQIGCSVDLAVDGREALRMARQTSYDLVFMDVHMPEMDGLEASTAIRAMESGGQRVPIIALTANAMDNDRERCLAAGMDAHVPKPMRRSEPGG